MSNIIQVPLMNPQKYVERSAFRDDRYHTTHFRKQLHAERNEPGAMLEQWFQPWQLNDRLSTQIHTNGDPTFTIKKCTGEEVDQITPLSVDQIPGNVINGIQLSTYLWKYKPESISGMVPGFYYHEIQIEFPDETKKTLISEPFEVRETWDNTLLVQYRDTRNRYGTIFSQNPQFSTRIFAHLEWTGTDELNETGFEDQSDENRFLSSRRVAVFGLNIGPKTGPQWGVAEWSLDRLQEALRCDVAFIDGRRYTKRPGEGIEQVRSANNPLRRGTIDLLERDAEGTYTFTDIVLNLFTLPTTNAGYPVAGSRISLVGQSVYPVFGVFQIDSLAGVAAFIASLNASLPALGLAGSFGFNSVTGVVSFVPDLSDDVQSAEEILLFYKSFTASVETTLPTRIFATKHSGGTHIINWGDGNLQLRFASPNIGLGFLSTSNHIYDTAGIRTVRIFHNDNIRRLQFLNNLNGGNVVSYGGLFPATLNEFRSDNGLLTTFNLELLLPCEASLQTISITNCGLNSIPGNPWGQNRFANLNFQAFNNNSLPSSAVESYIGGYFSCFTWAHSGTIKFEGQTPPAPITAPITFTFITLLTSAGQTVTTD